MNVAYNEIPVVPESLEKVPVMGGFAAMLDRTLSIKGALGKWDPQAGENAFAIIGEKAKNGMDALKERFTPSPSATPVVAKSPEIEAPQMAKAPSMGHDVQAAVKNVDLGSTKMFSDKGIHETSNGDLGNFGRVNLAFTEVPKASQGMSVA